MPNLSLEEREWLTVFIIYVCHQTSKESSYDQDSTVRYNVHWEVAKLHVCPFLCRKMPTGEKARMMESRNFYQGSKWANTELFCQCMFCQNTQEEHLFLQECLSNNGLNIFIISITKREKPRYHCEPMSLLVFKIMPLTAHS